MNAPLGALDQMLRQAGVWRGDGVSLPPLPGLPSGFAALDAVLPGGGWPVGATTEIFPLREGIGEWSLVLPALARASHDKRASAWVLAPRHRTHPRLGEARRAVRSGRGSARMPFAPALAQAGVDLAELLLIEPDTQPQALWALRQIIASNACALVLGQLDSADAHSLRRLQIAAESSQTVVLLFRPHTQAHQASPAALKLKVAPHGAQLAVSVLKRRGAPVAQPVLLARTQGPAAPACAAGACAPQADFAAPIAGVGS